MHTNDAISSVPRLTDLGIPPFLLSGSLLGLSAQRLARRLCPVCRTPEQLSAEAWLAMGGVPVEEESVTIYHPAGCPACGGKGYSGRISLAELIHVSSSVRVMIDNGSSTAEMKAALREEGVFDMRDDGMSKALAGLTAVEEVGRVVPWEEGEAG